MPKAAAPRQSEASAMRLRSRVTTCRMGSTPSTVTSDAAASADMPTWRRLSHTPTACTLPTKLLARERIAPASPLLGGRNWATKTLAPDSIFAWKRLVGFFVCMLSVFMLVSRGKPAYGTDAAGPATAAVYLGPAPSAGLGWSAAWEIAQTVSRRVCSRCSADSSGEHLSNCARSGASPISARRRCIVLMRTSAR